MLKQQKVQVLNLHRHLTEKWKTRLRQRKGLKWLKTRAIASTLASHQTLVWRKRNSKTRITKTSRPAARSASIGCAVSHVIYTWRLIGQRWVRRQISFERFSSERLSSDVLEGNRERLPECAGRARSFCLGCPPMTWQLRRRMGRCKMCIYQCKARKSKDTSKFELIITRMSGRENISHPWTEAFLTLS